MSLNRRLKTPVLKLCESPNASGAGVQHGDGAAVLRPAGDVVTDRHRTLLAVGDGAHAVRVYPARGEIAAHRLGTACAPGGVVFAGNPPRRLGLWRGRKRGVGVQPPAPPF